MQQIENPSIHTQTIHTQLSTNTLNTSLSLLQCADTAYNPAGQRIKTNFATTCDLLPATEKQTMIKKITPTHQYKNHIPCSRSINSFCIQAAFDWCGLITMTHLCCIVPSNGTSHRWLRGTTITLIFTTSSTSLRSAYLISAVFLVHHPQPSAHPREDADR